MGKYGANLNSIFPPKQRRANCKTKPASGFKIPTSLKVKLPDRKSSYIYKSSEQIPAREKKLSALLFSAKIFPGLISPMHFQRFLPSIYYICHWQKSGCPIHNFVDLIVFICVYGVDRYRVEISPRVKSGAYGELNPSFLCPSL